MNKIHKVHRKKFFSKSTIKITVIVGHSAIYDLIINLLIIILKYNVKKFRKVPFIITLVKLLLLPFATKFIIFSCKN